MTGQLVARAFKHVSIDICAWCVCVSVLGVCVCVCVCAVCVCVCAQCVCVNSHILLCRLSSSVQCTPCPILDLFQCQLCLEIRQAFQSIPHKPLWDRACQSWK